MRPCALYVGDEASAAGYRLAGVDTVVPSPGEEAGAFSAALERADLVMVSAAIAAHVAPASLRVAQARVTPLLLITPDRTGEVVLPELAQALRQQLGLEA